MNLSPSAPAAALVVSGVAGATRGTGTGRGSLDAFAQTAGPDVAYGDHATYAVFSVDPSTHDVRVSVVDGQGRLVRMIPAATVREMLTSMSNYSRRA